MQSQKKTLCVKTKTYEKLRNLWHTNFYFQQGYNTKNLTFYFYLQNLNKDLWYFFLQTWDTELLKLNSKKLNLYILKKYSQKNELTGFQKVNVPNMVQITFLYLDFFNELSFEIENEGFFLETEESEINFFKFFETQYIYQILNYAQYKKNQKNKIPSLMQVTAEFPLKYSEKNWFHFNFFLFFILCQNIFYSFNYLNELITVLPTDKNRVLVQEFCLYKLFMYKKEKQQK